MTDLELDADGHLQDRTQWTVSVAQTLADTLDVELTDVHYRILMQVRAFLTNTITVLPHARLSSIYHLPCPMMRLIMPNYKHYLTQV